MRILLTNDDGFNAKGIRDLYTSLVRKGHDVTIVAPFSEKSASGHGITLHRPLFLQKEEDNVYSIDAYPADCTLIALGTLGKEKPFDLVLSGINEGENLGQDLYYSGTLAAAREAAFRNIPSIALSYECPWGENVQNFDYAVEKICNWIENDQFLKSIPKFHLVNINFPKVKTDVVELTEIGKKNYSSEVDQRVSARGKNYYWIVSKYEGYEKRKNSDCDSLKSGKISISYHDLFPSSSIEVLKLKNIIEGL